MDANLNAEKSPAAKEHELFSLIQPERVSQLIEGQLKEAIIKHHYRAGDKLPSERELSQMFGASRSSVREALRALERSGFVVIKKGVQGGAFVIQKGDSRKMMNHLRDMLRFGEVSLEEVLQARLIFEPAVAAEAARKATPQDIELLEEITREQLKGFDPRNPAMQFDRNPRFHRILAEITGNQVFIIIMQTLMDIHAYRMNKFKLDQRTIETITAQHEAIIAALKKNDSSAAHEQVQSHILAVHHLHKQLDAGQ